MKSNEKGFSLIEMVLVLILLAILTVSAAPAITDIVSNANETQASYIVSQVNSGAQIYWANEALENDGAGAYPSTLDTGLSSGPCTVSNPCMGNVLEDPITDGSWRTNGSGVSYDHALTNEIYNYNSSTGKMTKFSGP